MPRREKMSGRACFVGARMSAPKMPDQHISTISTSARKLEFSVVAKVARAKCSGRDCQHASYYGVGESQCEGFGQCGRFQTRRGAACAACLGAKRCRLSREAVVLAECKSGKPRRHTRRSTNLKLKHTYVWTMIMKATRRGDGCSARLLLIGRHTAMGSGGEVLRPLDLLRKPECKQARKPERKPEHKPEQTRRRQ